MRRYRITVATPGAKPWWAMFVITALFKARLRGLFHLGRITVVNMKTDETIYQG